MGEDVIEQEKQPIVRDLFPVEKEYVLTAFKSLDPQDESSSVRAEVEDEGLILKTTNPHAFASFENLVVDYYPEIHEVKMRWGILICYRALRLKAVSKKVTLPELTQKFVQDYDEEQDKMAEKKADEKISYQSKTQTGLEIKREHISEFRNLEPEFSQIAEGKLRVGSDWLPEEDRIYLGIIDAYFLFRKGFSYPKNFSKAFSNNN